MAQIWTVGHSNKTLEDILGLLSAHGIEAIADVRRFPASRRHPHFAKDSLHESLNEQGITYVHFLDLGGRRIPRPDSRNTNWRNDGFRGYADYMETTEFQAAIMRLKELADERKTGVMCAEARWWQCHRSLIADYLKADGWTVTHILATGKIQEHPYTSAARIVSEQLTYSAETLFETG